MKETREAPADTALEVKKKIREPRLRREELREEGKRAAASVLGRKTSRLKKKSRMLARKAASLKKTP